MCLNLRPRTWVRKEVNDRLPGEGETKPLTASELDAALGYFCQQHAASWILGKATVDVDELDEASREELGEAVDAVVSDTMAVRRAERERQRGRDTEDRTWEPYLLYTPDWWDLRIDRMFARLRPRQREALALLDPPHPADEVLPVRKVPAALRGLAAASLPADVEITLDVPTGYHDYSPLLTYRRMVFRGQAHDPAGSPVRDRGLQRLETLAIRVAEATGCRQWEAIGYLLCDEVPWVPVLDVSLDREHMSVTLRIHHPEVPVEVVAAAYKTSREELGAREDTHHRFTSGWPGAVDNFVTEWQRAHGGRRHWPQMFAEFRARYPKAPYGSLESFRETCYRKEKRRRQAGKRRSAK